VQRLAEKDRRIVATQVHEHGPDLVGAVAETTEGLLDLRHGRTADRGPVTGHGDAVDRQVKGILQLDEQPGGGLLADAGYQAERREVVIGQDPRQLGRTMHAEHRQGQ
jgi:hypothetical protein